MPIKHKALNLKEALELYDLLAKFIPKNTDDTIDFAGKIIDNIIKSENSNNYFLSIQLMTGLSEKEILKMNAQEIFIAFCEYIAINRILDLVEFCKKIGYKNV